MDATVPEIRITQPLTQPEAASIPPQGPDAAAAQEHSQIRRFLLARGNSAIADRIFRALMVLCALSIFAIVILIAFELFSQAKLSWAQSGFKFFYTAIVDPDTHQPVYWDPVNGNFSAIPFIYGTLVSSFLSLLFAVPLAIGVAVFLTEMCPGFLRGPLAFLTELLAAIPSIIYGLWAVFVLVPLLRQYVNPALVKVLGWTGLFTDDNPTGAGYFTSGVILAIMILPIISSLTREVMIGRASLAARSRAGSGRHALGDDPHGRPAQCAHRHRRRHHSRPRPRAGRNHGRHHGHRQYARDSSVAASNGSSMASVIANEFAEATSDLHLSALIEIGLALFIVTIIVNAIAQVLVWAVTRGAPQQAR